MFLPGMGPEDEVAVIAAASAQVAATAVPLVAPAPEAVVMVEDALDSVLATASDTLVVEDGGAPVLVVPKRKPRAARALWPMVSPEVLADVAGPGAGEIAKLKANVAAIGLLRKLEADGGRKAESDEWAGLVKYTGWGGLPWAFEPYSAPGRMAHVKSVRDALLDGEWNSARDSTPNSHYTSPEVIGRMWGILMRAGFAGGRILEPSAGVGHFIGAMPQEIARKSEITAVELDDVSGRILRALYGPHGVRVLAGAFEKQALPSGFFDLVVSNVPFGNYKVADPGNPAYGDFSIHNYFIAKGLDLVRVGGLVAVITSAFTLDARLPGVRKYLATKADLVFAARLPMQAFEGIAGTSVTTDLLVFRKREKPLVGDVPSWTEPAMINTFNGLDCQAGLGNYMISGYYRNYPERVLGQVCLARTSIGQTVGCDARNAPNWLDRLERLDVPRFYSPRAAKVVAPSAHREAPVKMERPGFALDGDEVVFVQGNLALPVRGGAKQAERTKGLMEIRDLARRLVDAQPLRGNDDEVEDMRQRLNALYDAFVAKYGAIRGRPNRLAFARDSDFPLLLSLEVPKEEGEVAKADIFRVRTVNAAQEAVTPKSLGDAVALSIIERGRVDPAFMAQRSGADEDDLMAEMEDAGLVMLDPATGTWQTPGEYLSGDIREKLDAALAGGERFERNVKALEAVMPKPLEAADVVVRLGATWIPAEVYSRFIEEVFSA